MLDSGGEPMIISKKKRVSKSYKLRYNIDVLELISTYI